MKMLLDENLPQRLRKEFSNHEVFSVAFMGWKGKKNGELLDLMLRNDFEALITFNRSIQYQQNFSKYPLPIIILNAPMNDFETLSPMVPKIIKLIDLGELKPGANEITL